MGSSLTFQVAPGRVLKTPDQAAGWLPRPPTAHKQGMPVGTRGPCRPPYFQLHVVGTRWVTGRGAEGGNAWGWLMATINNQPLSRVTPNAIQGAGSSKISKAAGRRVLPWRLGHPYLLTMPLFRYMAQFWFGACVLVVEYF